MKYVFIIMLLFNLTACKQKHSVNLYKDKIATDTVLATFPSNTLEQAFLNCQSTLLLYKNDDEINNYISIITHQRPIYYCKEE